MLVPSRICLCGVFTALALVVCNTPSATGSDNGRRMYGNGVHLFYQGRLTEAIESFDVAAAEMQQDPRVYYFRGMAKRRLGFAREAEADLRWAAQLEATSGRQDVGRALQRIQGADRLSIERYRREARRLAKSGAGRPASRLSRAAESLPDPASKPQAQDLAVSDLPSNLPPDARDPFSDASNGLLGRGTIEKATHSTPVAEPGGGSNVQAEIASDTADEPLGSGFDADSNADDSFPADFTDDSEFQPAQTSPPATKKRGMLSSVFRAVTKSALPASPEQGKSLLQGLRGTIPIPGGPPGPGGPDGAAGPSDFSDDSFPDDGNSQSGDAPMDDQDPFDQGNADPFDDEPADDDTDSDADSDPIDDAGDPIDESADPLAEEEGDPFSDATDPFDEGDPFSDDQ